MTAHPATPATRPPELRGRRWLRGLAAALLLPLVGAAGLGAWLLGTQSGLETALALGTRLTDGALHAERPRGRVLGGFELDVLRYETPGLQLEVRDFELEWKPAALFERRLLVERLAAAHVELARASTDDTAPAAPTTLPDSLAVPLAIELRSLVLGAFVMRTLGEEEAHGQADERAGEPAGDGGAADLDARSGAGHHAAQPLFTELEAAFDSDGRRHRLRTLALSLPQGRLQLALGVEGAAPHALDGEGRFDGVIDGRAVAARFGATNTLLEPHLSIDAQGEGLTARVEVEAESLAAMPLRRLSVKAGEIDPAAFVDGAPRAALSLEAELAATPDAASLLAGPIRVTNRLPQAVDQGGIPLLSLDGRLDWRDDGLAVDALDLRLPGAGRIGGRVAWQRGGQADDDARREGGLGRIHAALELDAIDPGLLDSRLPRQRLAGRIDAEGDEARQQARVALEAGSARIDIQALLQGMAVTADAAAAETESGGSTSAGPAAAGRQVFELSARLRGADPRAFVAEAPSARLDLDLHAEGALPVADEPLSVALRFDILDSLLEGLPLRGKGQLRVEGERLPELALDVQLAGNSLVAEGALGAPQDRLALRLDAPALEALGLGLGGRASAEGSIGGALAAPVGRVQFFGEGLRLPGEVRIGGVNGVVQLDAGTDGPFALALGVSGLGSSAPDEDGRPQSDWVSSLRLAAEGTRASHRIELAAIAGGNVAPAGVEADALELGLKGGLAAGTALRWRGELSALQTTGRVAARLLAPVALELAPDAVRLGAAEFNAGDKGRIRLLETAWSPTRSVLRGELSGLVLELEPRRADGQRRRGADPLVLGARWDLSVGRTLDGEARVFREAGDVRLEGELRTRLGLERLDAVLRARGDRLELALDVRGSEFGSLAGEASVRARRSAEGIWSLPPDTALSASARLDMPSITWLGRLVRENVETAGRIGGAVAVSGTLAAPRASGTINGRELGFTLVDQGLVLSGGELDLAFDQERVRLLRLEFVSPNRVQPRDGRIPVAALTASPGRFEASGEVALDNGAGRFRFAADRLPLLQRDDRWMLLSGQGSARSTWSSLALDAEFRADAGYIEFAEAMPPSLSDDVVVLGRDEVAEAGAFAVTADVRVGLGDALYLSAMGLETRLAGDLRIRLQPGRALSAVGTVSTVGGSYRGYGQNLVIERGVVNFQGPLDAPGLNIVALRKGLEVEAGVAVTGSAKRPQVRLVSEPNVPDPAKLSWIVLGRAPDAASGADLGLLLPAAAALLGGPGGGMTEELSRSLGFDAFSIGQGELTSTSRTQSSRVLGSGSTVASGPTVSGQVLSLGKRLGPDLFLSFEQSLGGAATLVKLSYQLSRRLSLVARGGTDTSVDLHYGFSFR